MAELYSNIDNVLQLVGATILAVTALVQGLKLLMVALGKLALMTRTKKDDELIKVVSAALTACVLALDTAYRWIRPLSIRGSGDKATTGAAQNTVNKLTANVEN